MAYLDLVADILQRVSERDCALPEQALREIEMEVRAEWGGVRHYVAKVGEAGRESLERRNHAIRQAYAMGVPDTYLAVHHGISLRRIQQIVTGCVIARVSASDPA